MLRSFTRARFFSQSCRNLFPRATNLGQGTTKQAPTLREQLARSKPFKSFVDSVQRPTIGRQLMFVTVGSFLVFGGAAVQSTVETDLWMEYLSTSSPVTRSLFSEKLTMGDFRRIRYMYFGKQLQDFMSILKETVESWPQTIAGTVLWLYVQVAQPLLDASDGKRVCWGIVALNTAVWAAWQIPRAKPLMMRHFTHSPLSGRSYTLLTSMFSHKSFLHLVCNSFALASFGSGAATYLSVSHDKSPEYVPQANIVWHFLAFYISAGLFSGLASHVVSARVIFPRLVKKLSASATGGALTSEAAATAVVGKAGAAATESATASILPSLGASGAIYAAAAMVALAFPEAQVALIIPPTFPIPIQWGIGGLLTLDVIGIFRGWRFFDHYAHLGGALFGALYFKYGPRWWTDWMEACIVDDEDGEDGNPQQEGGS